MVQNALGDRGAQNRHALGQPGRNTSAVEWEIGGA
jgi:hypothetical protein